jgi:hypothetical protein
VLGSPLQEVYKCKGIVIVLCKPSKPSKPSKLCKLFFSAPKERLLLSAPTKNFAGKNDAKKTGNDEQRLVTMGNDDLVRLTLIQH